jgi:membrane associated rhomboid family serine protease
MIIPYIFGILSFREAPMTWSLCLLNCFMFVATLTSQLNSQNKIAKIADDDHFLNTQGYAFAHYILENSERYSDVMKELARGTLSGSKKKTKYLGNLAFRDFGFSMMAPEMELEGDQIALSKWRKQSRELASAREIGASNRWGLSNFSNSIYNFVSYQFLHGDIFHLASNMFFLMIFGAAIEPIVGALGIFLVFIVGGAAGAVIFTMVSGLSALPLIGASGSVSALMGVFAAFYRAKPVKFFFWVLPMKNYVGFVFLPAWVAVVMWVVMDCAGLIGTIPELGGTAHAAHLGGVTFGFLIGYATYLLNQRVFAKP